MQPLAKFLAVASPGVTTPDYFREIHDVLASNPGGPPDRAKLAEVMRRHGLTSAPPASRRAPTSDRQHWPGRTRGVGFVGLQGTPVSPGRSAPRAEGMPAGLEQAGWRRCRQDAPLPGFPFQTRAGSATVTEKQRHVLPMPDRAYDGLITYDAKDPDTAFPPIEPLRPPAGAPNVLVILLDDVGFAASSAFGGPVQHPDRRAARGRTASSTTASTPRRCARRRGRRC